MDGGLVNSLDGNGLGGKCYGIEGVFEIKRYKSCAGFFERESMS